MPDVVVRFNGRAPPNGKVCEMQRLRQNLWRGIFEATPLGGMNDGERDTPSGAMTALLKYGSGMLFNRIEQL